MNDLAAVALAGGAAWSSGLNLYMVVLLLGGMDTVGYIDLPPDLELLSQPAVLAAATLMYLVEFFADKVPGIDSGWDAIQTFIRIPAGALLAWGAVGQLDIGTQFAAFILGGGLAASSHAAKAGTRVLINTSPEPFSNWTASVTEDATVAGGIWAAVAHPAVFLGLLVLVVAASVWLLPKLWRGVRGLASRIAQLYRGRDTAAPPPDP